MAKLTFKLNTIEKIVDGELFALKLITPKGERWISKKLIDEELKGHDLYIESTKVEPKEGSMYKGFLSAYWYATNPQLSTKDVMDFLK